MTCRGQVLSQPSADSGSPRPEFVFAADWGSSPPDGAENVTFEMLLLGDADLGSFHAPPTCDPARINAASQKDCVDAGCSSVSCSYFVTLSQVRPCLRCVRSLLSFI